MSPDCHYIYIRIGKIGERGGEADIKVLSTYGRDMLTKTANYCWVSQKTTSSLLGIFCFALLKVACLTCFKAPNAARDKHV